jgi:hypothetical protein
MLIGVDLKNFIDPLHASPHIQPVAPEMHGRVFVHAYDERVTPRLLFFEPAMLSANAHKRGTCRIFGGETNLI